MKRRAKSHINLKRLLVVFLIGCLGIGGYAGYHLYERFIHEKEILKQMVQRLQADTRIAEVIVTDVAIDPDTQKQMTTIKFLEFDGLGGPLTSRKFIFSDNIIQFQSLVARFDDRFTLSGNPLKGKSAYLFWKVFVLDGPNTEEYVITPVNQIPEGYKIEGPRNELEDKIWQNFWDYALDKKKSGSEGIKNTQIEAPGTKFIPGFLYTLKIEHDGGIRIDATPIPAILKGETLL